MTNEESEVVEEAESLDYQEEVSKKEKSTEDKLFGFLPLPKQQTHLVIGLVVLFVIVLLLLSAIFEGFGIVGGVKKVKVFIPAGEGEESYVPVGSASLPTSRQSSNTAINDIEIRTTQPAFGKLYSGDADVKVIYDGDTLYEGKAKITDGKGFFTVNYRDFYIDNGEYEVKVEFKGKSGSDKVTIERTAKKVFFYQYLIGGEEKYANLTLKFDLMPSPDSSKNDSSIFTWGHGEMKIYYVSEDNEEDKNNPDNWIEMETISFEVSPLSFNYTFQSTGERVENSAQEENFTATYILNIPRDKFDHDSEGNENSDGYYTSTIVFYNDFGNKDDSRFDGEAKNSYPEENGQRVWHYIKQDPYPEDG